MFNVAVVIPFYQRKQGLLRRAVKSALDQRLNPEITLDIIIVDDGSPISSEEELQGMLNSAGSNKTFRIIKQKNGGVSHARNTALMSIENGCRYVAFLDSDDLWLDTHLQIGLDALEAGRDFYFCDNRREGHYASSFGDSVLLKNILSKDTSNVIELSAQELLSMNLREFVAHPQTSVFRWAKAKDLRFNTSFKNAGEDYLYFNEMLMRIDKCALSPHANVICGSGVNIYYTSIDWDSPTLMRRLVDELRSRLILLSKTDIAAEDKEWLRREIGRRKLDVAFHTIRIVTISKRWPKELEPLKTDPIFCLLFPFYCIWALASYKFWGYKPG